MPINCHQSDVDIMGTERLYLKSWLWRAARLLMFNWGCLALCLPYRRFE